MSRFKKKSTGVKPLNKKKATEKFLREVFRNTKHSIELRCINPADGKPKQSWYNYKKIVKLSEDIRNLDEKQQYDIYVGIHTRTEKGSKNDDVKEITSFCIDHDCENSKKPEDRKSVTQVIEELKKFPLHPSVIAPSGRGVHAYWLFKKPIPVKELPDYKKYQKGLAEHFGSDRAVSDLARVMRAPFTFNLKEIDQLVPDFPDPHSSEHIMVPKIHESECDMYKDDMGKIYRYDPKEFDYYADLKKEEPVAHITEIDVGRLHIPDDLKRTIREGWKEEEEEGFPSRSELDCSVISRLLQFGCSEDTVFSIFKDKNYGISAKYYEHSSPDAYLKHQINSAWVFLYDNIEEVIDTVITHEKIKLLHRKKAMCKLLLNIMTLHIEHTKGVIDNGKFYKSVFGKSIKTFYHDRKSGCLYHLASGEFKYFINEKYRINPHETHFKYLLHELETRSRVEGAEIVVHRTAFYDKDKKILYIHSHDGEMYRLDGNSINIVGVGHEEVFFHIEEAEPFGAEWEGCEGKLDELLCSRINSDEKAILNHEDQALLLKVWYLSLFFESTQPTKTINTIIGPQGSGKSFAQKSIGWVLYGSEFSESLFYKEDGFDVAAVTNYFIVWGNLDKKLSWAQDRLARIATGTRLRKRKLYSDLDEINEPAKCFLAINARTPQFKWADISERLLIFKVRQIDDENRISENEMKTSILKQRNLIWGNILNNLNKIVRVLREEEIKDASIRIADFSQLAVNIGKALGVEVKPLLDKVKGEQTDFMLTDSPLVEAIDALLDDNKEGVPLTASQLSKKDYFKNVADSPARLGIMLRNQLSVLEKRFKIEVFNKSGTNIYTFYRKTFKKLLRKKKIRVIK